MTSIYSPKKQQQNRIPEPVNVMHVVDKLSVSGSGVHGVTKAIESWILRFDPKQFQFSVCSLRSPEPAGETLEEKEIPVFFLSLSKFDPRTITSLLAVVKREQPHILHLHGYGATNFGRIVSFLTGIPNIVHEHAIFYDQPLYQTVADTFLSPLTGKAIAVSEPVRIFMIQNRKIKSEKVETSIIGVPIAEFPVPEPNKVQKIRNDLGISSDEQVVCNVSRLDTVKGQVYLLKAAVSILKELPKTRFLIVGDGPDMSMLQSVAQQEGIAERVIFTGFRRDINVVFSISNVVAIPSLLEGGPLTLFEAMNLRKPVVGTPSGIMGEVIRDGETGFLVPLKNTDLLAKKIVYLLKNPQLAKTMGEEGWKIAQNYDISHSVQRLSEIYRELAA